MPKLTEQQIATKATLARKYTEATEALTAAISEYNDALTDAYCQLRVAQSNYNDVIDAITAFASTVAQEQNDYVDRQSPQRQESDEGQACIAWLDTWQEIADHEGENAEVSEPDPLDADEVRIDLDSFTDLSETPEA